MLDALVEASAELKKKEAERTAVVAVTAIGIEFSSRSRYQVAEDVSKNTELVLALQIDEGDAGPRVPRPTTSTCSSELARRTGGLHETVLSSLGIGERAEEALRRPARQYRLSYAPCPASRTASWRSRWPARG